MIRFSKKVKTLIIMWMLAIFLLAPTVAFSTDAPDPKAANETEEGVYQSKLDEIMERGIIRIGTTGDYKPFTYYDKEKKAFSGIDIDMAQDLAKSMGVEYIFVKTTWKNIVKDLVEDKYDLAMGGISVKLSRQKKAFFSKPYLVTGKTPITRKESVEKYQTLEQIDKPGVTVIVNPGGTNEKFVRAHIKKAKILVYDDNVTIFEQLVAGKADLMITDAVETMLQEKLHPELGAVHPEAPFDKFEKAYLLPRGDMVFKEWVDLWLHTRILTGEYDRIFNKWVK